MIRQINNLKKDDKIYYDDPRNVGEVIPGLAVNLKDIVDTGIVPPSGTPPAFNEISDIDNIGFRALDDFAMLSLADDILSQPDGGE